jgi:predicted GIY-YIG superfamily endonuclease
LTNVEGRILYVGQSVDLCQRFNEHLDNAVKTAPTPEGRSALFYWRVASDIDALERGWLNAHRVAEGKLPYLNTNDSPVSY